MDRSKELIGRLWELHGDLQEVVTLLEEWTGELEELKERK